MSAKFKSTDLRTVAAILPRYGSNLGGGAEALVRELLIALVKSNIIERAEVWTTCATDHRTWDNALPEGLTVEDGITVIRFPVDERDLDTFIHAELAMAAGRPLTIDEQLDWLGAGVNSRSLYSHIKSNSDTVDVMLFAPYLFPTSFWGPLIDPTKSVIIPCLHNESYAYQSFFLAVLESVRGCLFNAIP